MALRLGTHPADRRAASAGAASWLVCVRRLPSDATRAPDRRYQRPSARSVRTLASLSSSWSARSIFSTARVWRVSRTSRSPCACSARSARRSRAHGAALPEPLAGALRRRAWITWRGPRRRCAIKASALACFDVRDAGRSGIAGARVHVRDTVRDRRAASFARHRTFAVDGVASADGDWPRALGARGTWRFWLPA